MGPALDGLSRRAAGRVPGMGAREAVRAKILDPNLYRVGESLQAMPGYRGKLSDRELDTLVDWLMTL